VPQRGGAFFKTKLAVLLVVVLALARMSYVHVRHSLTVADLQAQGYMVDADYDVPYSVRWRHPLDAGRGVTFFRYPRPTESPFERASEALQRAAIARRGRWQGRALALGRSAFLAATAPLLAPIDSREGFDPYSAPNEEKAKQALIEELLKRKTSGAAETEAPDLENSE